MKQKIHQFLRSEKLGGIILIVASVLGVIAANSDFSDLYFGALHRRLGMLSVEAWVNDFLMAFFFLSVGLEIKYELLRGALRRPAQRILPGVAAFFGAMVPAIVYALLNGVEGAAARAGRFPRRRTLRLHWEYWRCSARVCPRR